MRAISGSTEVVGVIGDPIAHSLSPTIHNAAFERLDLDWRCVAFQSPAGQAENAVIGLRALGIRGLSVTMPHKEAVVPALDELSEEASILGAVNCIASRGGKLIGYSTDGSGFIAALRADLGFDPDGRRCVVLGAGGAARSVVLALARAGAARVIIVNRTPERAAQAAVLAGEVGFVGDGIDVESADLIVNATPVGMEDVAPGAGSVEQSLPCEPRLLRPGQVVVDLVYHPLQTDLLRAAERAGCRVSNGVAMLVHQAAIAFELWTGLPAPVDAMNRAVRDRIDRTHTRGTPT